MDFEDSILPNLGRTVKVLDLLIEERLALAGIPLTKLQFVFLMVISRNNAQPQSNLAELTGRDKTTFTRNLNTLERKNFVKREASPLDKRSKLVLITSQGLDYVKKANPIIKQIIAEIEIDISDQERESFLQTLAKIKNKLTQTRSKQVQ